MKLLYFKYPVKIRLLDNIFPFVILRIKASGEVLYH